MDVLLRIFKITIISLLLSPMQAKAFSFGDIAGQVIGAVVVDKAAESASDALSNKGDGEQNSATAPPPQDLSTAPPIAAKAIPVTLSTEYSNDKIFSKRPKIAIAGYNIGSIQTAEVSAKSTREQGASVKMNLKLLGVDAVMLQRISNAAHSDLVAQLKKEGIDVIDAPAFFQSSDAQEVIRSSKPVSDDVIVVNGPSGVGVVSSFGLIPKGFNGNVGDQASASLNAIVVYPNLAFDFAWTSGGGTSHLNRKVSVEAGTRFAIDKRSNFHVVFSNDGRFVDDGAKLMLSEDVGVDDAFATTKKKEESDNSGSVGFSNALGFGMSSRKGSEYDVIVDPDRYEALAMNAVKGFNAELVRHIKSGKGL